MTDETLAQDLLDGPDAAAVQQAHGWPSSRRLTAMVTVLVCVGLVMVASAAGSNVVSGTAKRLALTLLGAGAFLVGARVPYLWWRRHSLAVLALALGGLAAVLVPGVGVQINAARRWINPGLPIGLQPSEFAKVALCIWVAAYCERNIARMRSPVHGFLVPFGVVGLACLLVLAEPDFGTAVLLGTVCAAVLLVFGTRLVYMLLAGVACAPIIQRLVIQVPYRLQRIAAFLDPWRDPQGSGYQLIQSKIAIGSGGPLGRGLGAGLQKEGFLPGADNDFIFSVIGEELGLIGCVLLMGLFAFFLYECLKVIFRARDPFAFALSLGLATLLGTQAAAHIAVVTGSVPTKGLSLPFISAGGSSLVASMFAAGVIVNIARSEEGAAGGQRRPRQDEVPAYERLTLKVLRRVGLAGLSAGSRLFDSIRPKERQRD
jgi:cell division protein FtsW